MQNDSLKNEIIDQLMAHDSLKKMLVNTVSELEKSKETDIMVYVVQILDTLAWPAVLLFLIWMFNKEFKGFFDRIKSLKASTTGLEFESFEKAKKETEFLLQNLPQQKSIEPPPDPVGGISKSFSPPSDTFTPTDPKMRVSKIQLDLQRKLVNKLNKAKIEISGSADIAMLNTILKSNNVIHDNEYRAIEGINKLINITLKNDVITSVQADQVLEIFKKLP